jgi:hypothetical protein
MREDAEYDPPRWRDRGWPDDNTVTAAGECRAAAATTLIPRAVCIPNKALRRAAGRRGFRNQ